jgi:hypothetical protein
MRPGQFAAGLRCSAPVADAQHHALAGGEHGGGLLGLLAGGGVGADDADLAADVLLQQLGRGQQVEVEVLLDHPRRGAVADASRSSAVCGLDAGADVAEGQVGAAGGQLTRRRSFTSARSSL